MPNSGHYMLWLREFRALRDQVINEKEDLLMGADFTIQ